MVFPLFPNQHKFKSILHIFLFSKMAYNANAYPSLIQELFDENSTDFDFHFATGSGHNEKQDKIVSVHRKLLSALSPKFHTLFNNEWKELKNISVRGSTFDAYSQLLQYFYKSEIDINQTNVIELIQLAQDYGVDDLFSACVTFLT